MCIHSHSISSTVPIHSKQQSLIRKTTDPTQVDRKKKIETQHNSIWMSASGSSSSSAGPMIPPVNQKTQLINVREFKQTYEDLIKKKTQIRVEERQELNAASHNFLQPNSGRNNLQQPNPGRHFQDPGRFLLNTQEQWNLYDCADLLIPTPYDIIEQSIKEQIEKTKVNDNNYSGNPSKIAEETGLGLGEIVTISHIEQMQQSNLLSLTYVFWSVFLLL